MFGSFGSCLCCMNENSFFVVFLYLLVSISPLTSGQVENSETLEISENFSQDF